MNLSVILAVSPAAATPTGFLQPEILKLSFPVMELWVLLSVSLASYSSRFIHMRIGPPSLPAATMQGVLTTLTACIHPSYQSE